MSFAIQCEPIAELPVGNELGEGAIWDDRRGRFWWVDIMNSTLFACTADGQDLQQFEMPERLACLAPIDGSESFLGGFESGFAVLTPTGGIVEWLHRVETDNPGNRMNDGGTDRQGRFWAGTMVEDRTRSTSPGTLYRVGLDRQLDPIVGELTIPNCLAFSPDGKTMYHCCSVDGRILAYDFDTESGTPSGSREFASTSKGVSPDGSAVDAAGRLWNAQWGGHQVQCYDDAGDVAYTLKLDVPQPTCVAFGGEQLDILMVTTARQGMSESDLNASPSSGNLYLFKTNVTGLVDAPFRG